MSESLYTCCVQLGLSQEPLAMAREFDLVTSWNSYITNSPILKVQPWV